MSTDLNNTIARLISDAANEGVECIRSDLFDRYMGEKYGDEIKGRSQFTATDVSDAVEAILADIMDVFTSAEDIIEFDPVGPEDDEAAKQETAVVSHLFWQKNRGFENLYVWIKEALIQQNSYIRFGWEDSERVEIEEYQDLTPDELATVLTQIPDEYEIIEHDSDGETGAVSVKLRITRKDKRYIIEPVPQEEFFLTPRWGKLGLDGVPCCGHKREMTRNELLAMGFSSDSIDALGDDSDSSQKESRNDTQDFFESESNDDKVTVYEAYVRADNNGDGVPELLRVWASGSGTTILEWKDGSEAIEEVPGIPFAALTPYLIPHRHVGRSVSEQVDDIQKVNTILMRTTLDNIYATQYGRPVVDPDLATEDTYNDFANPAQGAPIRYSGAVQYHMPPSVAGATLPLMEKFADIKESRIGSTRYNQGLDANSLNKTASGISQIMSASQKRNKLIARTFAETGMRDLFLGIHRDLRSGPMKEIAMKIRGAWVQANPRTWRDRTDMTVNVGMGRGDRDEKRQGLMLIGQVQEKMMAAGSRMVDEAKIYATAERVARTFGFESADVFFNDPRTLPPVQPQQQQPDPALMLATAQVQNMQQETARRAADDQAKRELERERMEREFSLKTKELELRQREQQVKSLGAAADIQKDAAKLELERDKAINADDLARDKLEMDAVTGALDREARIFQSAPAVPYSEFGE